RAPPLPRPRRVPRLLRRPLAVRVMLCGADGPPARHSQAAPRGLDRMREPARPRLPRSPDRARRRADSRAVRIGVHHRRAPLSHRLARPAALRVSARMKERLRVGVVLPTYRRLANPANIKRAAELSEALGFDSVWVTDHIVVPAASVEAFGPTFFEAVTTMAYVAGFTSRVLIGAAILIVPYRHPLLLAKMLASADQLSGGRLIVGAGLGWL